MENDTNPPEKPVRRRYTKRVRPEIIETKDIPLEAEFTPERPEMRRPMRDEDPRAAAERRAQEILNHLGGEVDAASDDFYVDRTVIPDGWDYEWKRKSTYNLEDPAYQVALANTGWTPVPASRHPEMMPIGTKDGAIERKGMILMERPLAVTEKFREADRRKAIQQVRFKEEQLSSAPQGHFDRDHPQARPNIKKGYEPIPVPKD